MIKVSRDVTFPQLFEEIIFENVAGNGNTSSINTKDDDSVHVNEYVNSLQTDTDGEIQQNTAIINDQTSSTATPSLISEPHYDSTQIEDDNSSQFEQPGEQPPVLSEDSKSLPDQILVLYEHDRNGTIETPYESHIDQELYDYSSLAMIESENCAKPQASWRLNPFHTAILVILGKI